MPNFILSIFLTKKSKQQHRDYSQFEYYSQISQQYLQQQSQEQLYNYCFPYQYSNWTYYSNLNQYQQYTHATNHIQTQMKLINEKKKSSPEEYKPIYSPEINDNLVMASLLPDDDQNQNRSTLDASSTNVTSTSKSQNIGNSVQTHQSTKEEEILNSIDPIPPPNNESEKQIEELGISGIIMNSDEIKNWQGDLTKHKLRDGPTKLITKEISKPIEYEQNISVQYLKAPTSPPLNIILKKEPHKIIKAPPLIVRLPECDQRQPETIIIREPPPTPPPSVPDIVIPIPGRDYYMPRKVIKEMFEPLLTPQNIIIEKWLPYKEAPPNVIYKPAPSPSFIDEQISLHMKPEASVKKRKRNKRKAKKIRKSSNNDNSNNLNVNQTSNNDVDRSNYEWYLLANEWYNSLYAFYKLLIYKSYNY